MGNSKPNTVDIPSELWNRAGKHPECVERIVAELEDGTEVDFTGFSKPKGLVAYRIEYKKGPCMDDCPRVKELAKDGFADYAEKGCYNGRVDRVEVSEF